MKKVLTFTAVLVAVAIAFSSCKKDKTPDPLPVTSCFEDAYNGSYTGNLVAGGIPSTATVKITKISCTSARLESTAFTTITVNSLNASAVGAYVGTTNTNQTINIGVTQNTLAISGPLDFSGTR